MSLCWSIKGAFFSLKMALKAKVAAKKKEKSLQSAASQETVHLGFILHFYQVGKTSDLRWRRINWLLSNASVPRLREAFHLPNLTPAWVESISLLCLFVLWSGYRLHSNIASSYSLPFLPHPSTGWEYKVRYLLWLKTINMILSVRVRSCAVLTSLAQVRKSTSMLC